MQYTIASLARHATVTSMILAHCAGLRSVGQELLAKRIEAGDYSPSRTDSADVRHGLSMLRVAVDRDGDVGDTSADITSAFGMMLRDSAVEGGTDNVAYSAARLEALRAWVAVDDAISAMRSAR